MLIPLLSVSLIGLIAGVVGLTRRAPAVVLIRCFVMAWMGFVGGAILGLVVEAFVIGGFWLLLGGHVSAVVAATRTARLSVPSDRRGLTV